MIKTPAKSDTSLNQIGKPPDREPSQVSPLKGAFLFELGTIMDQEYALHLLETVKPYVDKNRKCHRRCIYYQGNTYKYAHIVWFAYNPDDPILEGEVIHHKDGDSLNDSNDNLSKMKHREHSKLHVLNISDETRSRMSKSRLAYYARVSVEKRAQEED